MDADLLYCFKLGWSGKKFEFSLHRTDTVGDLKQIIWSLTNVSPIRQKLLGLIKGKQLPGDDVALAELGLAVGFGKAQALMMIGTPEGEEIFGIINGGPFESDEGDVDYTASQIQNFKATQVIRNKRKIDEAVEALEINLMRAPRPGKKLLVLDLDYAILDTSRWKEQNFNARDFARPHLHEFLSAISPHYDIIIWSQTSWRWLESKLIELGLVGDPSRDYNIVFVLDRKPMFSVYSEREGKPFKHEVKALEIIWRKFPLFYNQANTVHVDDLSRNFAMNPQSGIKVHAYRDSKNRGASDKELKYVKRYLLQLTLIPDWRGLDHSNFRNFVGQLPPSSNNP